MDLETDKSINYYLKQYFKPSFDARAREVFVSLLFSPNFSIKIFKASKPKSFRFYYVTPKSNFRASNYFLHRFSCLFYPNLHKLYSFEASRISDRQPLVGFNSPLLPTSLLRNKFFLKFFALKDGFSLQVNLPKHVEPASFSLKTFAMLLMDNGSRSEKDVFEFQIRLDSNDCGRFIHHFYYLWFVFVKLNKLKECHPNSTVLSETYSGKADFSVNGSRILVWKYLPISYRTRFYKKF